MENTQLDEEWLQLVEELIKSEVSKEDFREFIQSKRKVTENQQ